MYKTLKFKMGKKFEVPALLFVVSFVVLSFEISQMRIFGYALPPVLSYCAISFAMLGMSGGAVFLALYPEFLKRDFSPLVVVLVALLAASIVFSCFAVTLFPYFNSARRGVEINLGIVLCLLPSIIPYFLAGFLLSVVFSLNSARAPSLYFYNMAGSASGCFMPILLMRSIGVEGIIVIEVLLLLVISTPFVCSSFGRGRGLVYLLFGFSVGLVLMFGKERIFGFRPDPKDHISQLINERKKGNMPEPVREFSRWDPVARVEVYRIPLLRVRVPESLPYRIIMVDAGASTTMIKAPHKKGWGRHLFAHSLYGIGYWFVPSSPSVLVVGVGGGIDLQSALYWDARKITGVEISRAMIDIISRYYSNYFLAERQFASVKIVNSDGRTFAKGAKEKFDVVQLSGVDTFTINSPGAMAFVEDYLYTLEGFADFIKLLSSNGVFVVLRFTGEGMKLAKIAVEALRALSVANPEEKVIVLGQGRVEGVVVKKSGFSLKDRDKLKKILSRTTSTGLYIPHYNRRGITLNMPFRPIYIPDSLLGDSSVAGSGVRFKPPSRLNMHIPTDDRPYYMIMHWFSSGKDRPAVKVVKFTWIIIIVMSLLFVFLPILTRGVRVYPVGIRQFALLGFFFFIGAGYMIVELGFIRKSVIFIGYPSGSATVVIASMLAGTALGSYFSWKGGEVKMGAAGGIVVFATGFCFLLFGEKFFDLIMAEGDVLRWVVIGLLVMLAGVPMGFMFPSGIRLTGRLYPALVPWVISVNGASGGGFSVASFPISLFTGIKSLIVIGLTFYLLAVISVIFVGSERR